MNKQKFKAGTKVRVSVKGTNWEHHLKDGRTAIVQYTYGEEYGGDCFDEYSLKFKKEGFLSWFDESQLTKVTKK